MNRMAENGGLLLAPPAGRQEMRGRVDWALRYLRRLQLLRDGIVQVHGRCGYDTEKYYLFRRKMDRVNRRITTLMRYCQYLSGKALRELVPNPSRSPLTRGAP